MPRTKILHLLMLLVLLPGCSHVISEAARERVTPGVEFADVRSDPSAHIGQTLLLGGVIVNLQTMQAGSEIEIYHWNLDRWGEPISVDGSGGRFLARTDRLLDPVAFPPGRLVTLTATMTGVEERPLLGIDNYRYPVMQLGEIYPWVTPYRYMLYPGPNPYQSIYVEEGDRRRTHPYDPGYYNYPYTPYDLRPGWR